MQKGYEIQDLSLQQERRLGEKEQGLPAAEGRPKARFQR